MSMNSRLLCATLLAQLALPTAHAAGAIRWDCVQTSDRAYHARCMARSDDDPAERTEALRVDASTLPPPRPGLPDMRPVAQRGADAQVDAEPWLVPMHAAPSDPQFARALLESVLCGARPACRVSYRDPAARVALR